MPLTLQKLQARVAQLAKVVEGPTTPIEPVFVTPAEGPMTQPPAFEENGIWTPVEIGQTWGVKHGTSWLAAQLQVPEEMRGKPVVMQLHWKPEKDDGLLLRFEATVFLDGRASGAFDYKHLTLLLPECICDEQMHEVRIQVYTSLPLAFGGLTLRVRHEALWRLYHIMATVLDTLSTLDKNDIAYHVLLDRLNAAYNMLDLREGWHSTRLLNSGQEALQYVEQNLSEGLRTGTRPRITISGHAHLDVAWLWPYWRTRQKIAHTVSTVLNLMERYPFYHYSQSQPQLLQWLKEDLPEVYARVKERVAEGRFESVGAMWVESDCNLTSGESLIRQIMFGTRFIQEEFGITPKVIWLPDVFGYSAALPQIMRKCDIPVFMTTKISWSQFNRMPCDTFRWRGIDGSEVLTHFITAPDGYGEYPFYTYNGPLKPRSVEGTWTNYRQQAINSELLYLGGWGDGGGGPAEDQLERVQVMATLPDFPEVRMGRADEFFASLYERVWDHPRLPTWVGELYLEYHRGTYTSQGRTKKANRKAELLYRDVELLNSWASLYGMPSRQTQLNEGWQRILLNQFHDVLPGSSIHEVYDDVERIYAEIQAIGEQVRDEALDVLRQQISIGEGDVLLVNTLPWERTDPVAVPEEVGIALPESQRTQDWDGNTFLLVDTVAVPGCGATVIKGSEQPQIEGSCQAHHADDGRIVLENDFYELVLDEHGEISHLYDKRAERNVLTEGQTGNQLVAYEDRPLQFDAWDIDIFYEEKAYPLHEVAEIRIVENGPVRATVEVVRPFMASQVTQRISLWRRSPRIDFVTEVDWHQHQTLLKAAFPVAINSTRATYEIQFGNVERPTHRNTSWDFARFEVCAHKWVDLSEGGYGISLLNDCKYGHDVYDGVIRLTLLKSGVEPDPDADQGIHRFTYSLLPHQGDWREAETVRRAYELNVPVLSVKGMSTGDTRQDGQKAIGPFIITDCNHVVVDTVKPAEDGDGLIVRLYEAHNQRGSGTLTFASEIVDAEECNPLEATIGEVAYAGNSLDFSVLPFEIKTFRVRLSTNIAQA